MTAVLLDGKHLAQVMQTEIAAGVADFVSQTGIRPGLATVLVGDNSASQLYVKNKHKACAKVGMTSFQHALPAGTSLADLLALVARLNADPAVHGILVQLPLPPHINEAAVVDAVAALKDVDGFGPESLGLLAAGRPRYLACTPHGVQQLLQRNGIDVTGKHVVIVGRSNIVGKPLALILIQREPAPTPRLPSATAAATTWPPSPAPPTWWSWPSAGLVSSRPTWSVPGPSSSTSV